MKKNIKGLMITALLGLAILAGCQKNEVKEEVKDTPTTVIEHELGKLELADKPKTIVAFDYGTIENLDLMGVEISGLPKKTLPENLSKYKDDKYTDVGGLKEPNFEIIHGLKPDLIIISGRQADMYEDFSKIAPTLYLTIDGSKYMEDFKANVKDLETIFGENKDLEEGLVKIEDKLNEIKKTAEAGKNALFIMTNDGSISAYGKGSRFALIHNEMNIPAADENIEVSGHGQKVAYEYIKKIDPDFLFVMDRAAIVGGDNKATDMLKNDIVDSTKAAKEGNIVYLTSPAWYVGAGGIESTNIMIDDIVNSYK